MGVDPSIGEIMTIYFSAMEETLKAIHVTLTAMLAELHAQGKKIK